MSSASEARKELKKALDDGTRKYKGRVVFQGNQVRDESGLAAVFSDQASGSAHLKASRLLDVIARAPDCPGQQSDAVSARTRTLLHGDEKTEPVETWVALPHVQEPSSWANIPSPMCRLRLALYGHPLSGVFWERHCLKRLKEVGWELIEGWGKHAADQAEAGGGRGRGARDGRQA